MFFIHLQAFWVGAEGGLNLEGDKLHEQIQNENIAASSAGKFNIHFYFAS